MTAIAPSATSRPTDPLTARSAAPPSDPSSKHSRNQPPGKSSTRRARPTFDCTECETPHPQWTGRCTGCGAWNTVSEQRADPDGCDERALPRPGPQRIVDVDVTEAAPESTLDTEVDRVLGGGLVRGSVTLLGGEPGVGKSTLLLQLANRWRGAALYVSAEESAAQVRSRAERLGALRDDLWLHSATQLPQIIESITVTQPSLVVIDSIQTIFDPASNSAAGSVGQVRQCAQRLVDVAKATGIAIVLVGHVTKDGSLAGPRVLEHVVDTVLQFEGDAHHALRTLRSIKHRFGPTNELGLFEMRTSGLDAVGDPSLMFLADRRANLPGSALLMTIEGRRPLVVEVQALTSPAPPGVPPRRVAQGLDASRLSMLLAVATRRAGLALPMQDVYASTIGGVRVDEPGADLATCLAVASAALDVPLPGDLVVCGEVGLGGEIRQVSQIERRIAEAARLGFARALIPSNAPPVDRDVAEAMAIARVGHLGEALARAGLVAPPRSAGGSEPEVPADVGGARH